MIATDSKAFRAFEKGFLAHMVHKDIEQANGIGFTYKGKECGQCMGAHLCSYFDWHEEHGIPIETYSPGILVGMLKDWHFRGEHIVEDYIESGEGDEQDFIVENIDHIGWVYKHGDGIRGLQKFLGLDDDEFDEFREVLGQVVGHDDPWGPERWRIGGQFRNSNIEARQLIDAIRYYEHFLRHWVPHLDCLIIRGKDREGVWMNSYDWGRTGRMDLLMCEYLDEVSHCEEWGGPSKMMPRTKTQLWDQRNKEDE